MYDTLMSVNKKFKSSVNLQYDLYNKDKILQYIPTTDLCDVISSYIDSVLENGKKSTFLAGPYGKGKSYLMLMITYLLSKREDRDLFKKVLNKISKIDKKLSDKIEDLDNKHISLLPVIINNNNSDDLNRNFLLALNNALIEHGIKDIVPTSAYTEALKVIENWEQQYSASFDIFAECQKSLNIEFNKVKTGLSNYDSEAFEKFQQLFQCVNHGYQFNSLISSDFGLTYTDVSKKVKKYGYSGLFVIFDEFGVFLENQSLDFISKLNKIQSFSEKCETSEENSQMHICCITHKDITLYGSDTSYLDSFQKIAGRFKQIRFDRSLEENYQIICSAIQKEDGYQSFVLDYIQKHNLLNKYKNSQMFSANEINYIFNNGFPFNPFALYALIQVSEKVAQNERTLFTFMSDTDVNSFNYFIANNNNDLLNVPAIYDYFEPLIKDNSEYRLLCYKVESLQKSVLKSSEREIVKCIAISKIINDNIKYNCTDENIALALNKDLSEIKKTITSMIDSNILKRNINDNTIDFSVIADNQFLKMLDENIESKFAFESLSKLLNDFNQHKYFVSNKYNFKNKMVRFFRAEFVEASVLNNLNNLDVYFSKEFSDGLIINLINDINLTQKEIKNLLAKFNKINVIVRYHDSLMPLNIIKKLKRLFSAKNLLLISNTLSDDVKNALPIFINDEMIELNNFLDEYNENAKLISLLTPDEKTLSNNIDLALSNLYSETVIINNEQVNKMDISAVTNKARINVVDLILNNAINDYSPTSAEGTIYDSFIVSIDNSYEIVNVIKEWFIANSSNRLQLKDLVFILKNSPYGMRSGVIPLFVAKAISDLAIMNNDYIKTVILYNSDLEIPLTAVNLCKALTYPDQYYMCFTEVNHDKMLMIKELMSIFKCKTSNSFNENIIHLMEAIKNTIENLPPVIIKSSKSENILGLTDISLNFKDKFLKHDLNTYELLLIQLPKLLKTQPENVATTIESILNEYNKKLDQLYQNTTIRTINAFGANMDSIKSTYDLWKGQYPQIKNVIFENQEKMLYRAFETIKFNNKDALNLLSYSLFNSTLYDWNTKKQMEFYQTLNSFINKVYNYDDNAVTKNDFTDVNTTGNISLLGKTLYSNLIEIINEYGTSLSNEEKAIIIKNILNDLIN